MTPGAELLRRGKLGAKSDLGYSKYLVVASMERVSPQRLNFPLNDIGEKALEQLKFLLLRGAL